MYLILYKDVFHFYSQGIVLCCQVTGVSLTPGSDQLVIIHLSDENDLVLCLQNLTREERVGEVLGTLCSHYQR